MYRLNLSVRKSSTQIISDSIQISGSWFHRSFYTAPESDAHKYDTGSIHIETGKLAKFADGACTVRQGDTTVLVTAVGNRSSRMSPGFVPLTVEYRQKSAAAGRIPTTHLRRELGFTEKETLTSRMIDRSVRPLFFKGYSDETQVICNLLAVDGHHDPDILAINGASASLALSDIPWNGPVGSVRIGMINDDLTVNPSRKELSQSRMNVILTATESGNVIMVDGGCNEPIMQPDIYRALKLGLKECRKIINNIKDLQAKHGRAKRLFTQQNSLTQEQIEIYEKLCTIKLTNTLRNVHHDKISRDKEMSQIREDALKMMRERDPTIDSNALNNEFTRLFRKIYSLQLKNEQIRCDGRKFDQLRNISCAVDLYKPLHGSGIFQRGQTQVFCSCTYDSLDAAFRNDAMTIMTGGMKDKNFMLHYEFPPYATNETGKTQIGRREIGHGSLAEKSLRPIVPPDVGMTVRLNCEVLESNGSSSMASVCAGSLALMDAGVKISEPAAGVAMGLLSNLDEICKIKSINNQRNIRPDWPYQEMVENLEVPELEYYLLTDILGLEDYAGDMDFKLAGTRRGITALQLDVKLSDGLPLDILREAIQKGHTARIEILNIMENVIKTPREEKKENHPVVKMITIPPHQRAKFLGFGGCNLKRLMHDVGVRITGNAFSDSDDSQGASSDNTYTVFAPNQAAMDEADEYIRNLIESGQDQTELEFNTIQTATIKEIRDNGVMVTLYPTMRPILLPLRQLDVRQVNHPSALGLEVGQQIQVKYFNRDPDTGQMRISRKALQQIQGTQLYSRPKKS